MPSFLSVSSNLKELYGIREFVNLFSDSTNSDYLKSVGLEYKSTYRNIIGLILLSLLVIMVHLVMILPLYLKSRKYGINNNFKIYMEPVLLFFNFTVYIRIILEAFVVLSLSSILEFKSVGPNEAIVLLVL